MTGFSQLLLLLMMMIATVQGRHVCIVGSGVSGASAAYFLQGQDTSVTVFEKEQWVGGRAHTIGFGDTSVLIDAGATSISSANQYLTGFVKQFNLTKKGSDSTNAQANAQVLGIWDGQQFVFETSESGLSLPWNIVTHYGFSPVRIIHAVRSAVDKLAGDRVAQYC